MSVTSRSFISFVYLTMATVFFLNNPLIAMEEEKPQKTVSPKATPKTDSFESMSHEELLKLVRAQQEQLSVQNQMLSGVTLEEREVARILGTSLSSKIVTLIDALTLAKKEKISLDEALDKLEEDEEYHYAEDRELTIRKVLEDKKNISSYVARKLFRGVLVGTNEKETLNFGRYQWNNPKDTLESWITNYLIQPYHILKVIYPNGGLTDCLIRKYLDIREDGYSATKTKKQTVGMF